MRRDTMNSTAAIAIRMFCTVHGYTKSRAEDGMREFFCLNSSVQKGWLKLARQTQAKLREAVNRALGDEH